VSARCREFFSRERKMPRFDIAIAHDAGRMEALEKARKLPMYLPRFTTRAYIAPSPSLYRAFYTAYARIRTRARVRACDIARLLVEKAVFSWPTRMKGDAPLTRGRRRTKRERERELDERCRSYAHARDINLVFIDHEYVRTN